MVLLPTPGVVSGGGIDATVTLLSTFRVLLDEVTPVPKGVGETAVPVPGIYSLPFPRAVLDAAELLSVSKIAVGKAEP